MNKRNIFIGFIFILISIWMYSALSSFSVLPGPFPKSIVIREGIERPVDEVAKKLADDFGFDLDGAYRSGYTPSDIVEYLISQPHTFDVSFYEGRFYEGRVTVLHILPFSVCIFLFLAGTAIIIFKGRVK